MTKKERKEIEETIHIYLHLEKIIKEMSKISKEFDLDSEFESEEFRYKKIIRELKDKLKQ